MKKIDFIIYSIIIICLSLVIFYAYQTDYRETAKEDDKEIEYISSEIKRSKIEPAIKLIEENKYDEALIVLERYKDTNPFLLFYKGLALYGINKKNEGLNLIKLALQSSPVLYDIKYKNNVRHHMESILKQISSDRDLKNYRHFIESKLKGGCG
ncbi:MAG: hypothetical protein N2202_06065 [Proteobacteria bacterium]|nr:hypothetical protein [Pseudomonadota bacterium]